MRGDFMIKYTSEEIKSLASEMALYFHDDVNSWHRIVDRIKERTENKKEIILELVCDTVFALTRKFSEETGLVDQIFNTPLKMMPVYIGSKDQPWKKVVAMWRLTIQK